MGLFASIKAALLGNDRGDEVAEKTTQRQAASPATSHFQSAPVDVALGGITISVSSSWSGNTNQRPVDARDVERKFNDYAYVCSPVLPGEISAPLWFPGLGLRSAVGEILPEDRRWLIPFMDEDVITSAAMRIVAIQGPHRHKSIAVALRALIREKRKAKEPHHNLLHALYGAAVLADFLATFETERQTFFTEISPYVRLDDLKRMKCSFRRMGYNRISTLKKTDVKWLVEEFGEPDVHLSFRPLWETLRRDAVRRYCRAEISSRARTKLSTADVEAELPGWLRQKLQFSIELDNENKARAAATLARAAASEKSCKAMKEVWGFTHTDFIVADIETTGLDCEACEILELAAVRADSNGIVVDKYSALVRITCRIPLTISELTGISDEDVTRHGISEAEALRGFLSFASGMAVFFHNAPFDIKFLTSACSKHGFAMCQDVFDTLPIARAAWPDMTSHKLSTLAKIIENAPVPSHRALTDAQTTLSVLLAAREIAGFEQGPLG